MTRRLRNVGAELEVEAFCVWTIGNISDFNQLVEEKSVCQMGMAALYMSENMYQKGPCSNDTWRVTSAFSKCPTPRNLKGA